MDDRSQRLILRGYWKFWLEYEGEKKQSLEQLEVLILFYCHGRFARTRRAVEPGYKHSLFHTQACRPSTLAMHRQCLKLRSGESADGGLHGQGRIGDGTQLQDFVDS